MTLHGGRAVVTGRRSDVSLYDYNLATYDADDVFDQSLAKGFVEYETARREWQFALEGRYKSSRYETTCQRMAAYLSIKAWKRGSLRNGSQVGSSLSVGTVRPFGTVSK